MTRTHVKKRARAQRILIEGGTTLLPFISTLTGRQRKEDLSCKNSLLSLRYVKFHTAYFSIINLCAN